MSRAGFVVLGPGLVAPSPGAGARKSKVRELGRSEGRQRWSPTHAARVSEARGPRLKAQGPRPKAPRPQGPKAPRPQGPKAPRPKVQGPRSKVQGPRSKVQGPRSKVRDPSPSPSPSLEAHAKPSSPENPGDPKPLRIAETPASRQAAESNT
ncbi:hypothetical protein X948_3266 [Burkholderia pseudomallei MSHR5608]|nr:hypothetical protein X948_3266 [Burkholderia pseudomallei MSHR5608]